MSKISLKYEFGDVNGDSTEYELKVWVYETSNNIPANIFLFTELPDVPDDIYASYEFVKVCSYADMLNYSLTAEDEEPFYRDGQLWLRDKSLYKLYNKLEEIQTDVEKLVNDIVNTHTASPTTYKVITG
jgi:hypothetical protein